MSKTLGSYDDVLAATPEDHRKLISHIKKTNERAKKKKHAGRGDDGDVRNQVSIPVTSCRQMMMMGNTRGSYRALRMCSSRMTKTMATMTETRKARHHDAAAPPAAASLTFGSRRPARWVFQRSPVPFCFDVPDNKSPLLVSVLFIFRLTACRGCLVLT